MGHAGMDALGKPQATPFIACENRTGKSEFGLVGEFQRVLLTMSLDDRNNGAKQFTLGQRRVVIDINKHMRRQDQALRLTTQCQMKAGGLGFINFARIPSSWRLLMIGPILVPIRLGSP